MTAAYITAHGPASAILVGPLPTPEPGPAEALVRIQALAVNHVDTFVRSGTWPTATPFPFVVGRDLVGVVERVGSAVSGFGPNDAVWCNSLGHDGRQGSFAQYAVVPEERLYPLPAQADPIEAVSLLHTAATAHLGLSRDAHVQRGETVVIGGAGGGVGSAAIQLARAAGARVIATAAAGDADWCRSLGADEVFAYDDPHLEQRIAAAAPDGVDVYWDTSGHQDLTTAVGLLARGGRVVLSAGLSGEDALPTGGLYTKDGSIHGFVISNASVADLAAAAGQINERLAARSLQTRIGLQLSLAETAAAHHLIEAPRSHRPKGRIVVLP